METYSVNASPTSVELKTVLWPDVRFYDKQVEIIESVERNFVTVVPAGNKLGVYPPIG